MRLRLDLSYDGTDFAGWAIQPGQRTVQGELEAGLARVLRREHVRLTVAGRTDAGVHALGQVAHLDVDEEIWHRAVASREPSDRRRVSDTPAIGNPLVRRLAGVLPADVRVLRVEPVAADFDARFSALWRRYHYRIVDADGGPSPLERNYTAGWRCRLDVSEMIRAAETLLGLHDFAAFCRRREGATSIRELQSLQVLRQPSGILIDVRADAFCHSMVRSLVGGLAAVGEGRRDVDWLTSLLERPGRADEVTVAPPRGLTLIEVGYPEPADFARRAAETRIERSVVATPEVASAVAPSQSGPLAASPVLMSPALVRIVDLSVEVRTGMPVYPGDPPVEVTPALTIAEHGVNVSAVHLGSQSGTHVDAPRHTEPDGATLAELPLSRFVGPAVVADVRGLVSRSSITADLISHAVSTAGAGTVLLLCTGWSQYWASERYLSHPALDVDAAQLIVDSGIRTIGIDALSIDLSPATSAAELMAHHVIAGAGGVIVENLCALEELLRAQQDGCSIEVMVLPIKLAAEDGAPVRAIARVTPTRVR